jgi:hypothetical protein
VPLAVRWARTALDVLADPTVDPAARVIAADELRRAADLLGEPVGVSRKATP